MTAHFGDKGTPTRSISRAVTPSIPVMEAPYTADFISAKKAISTVIQANWDLSAKSGWGGSYGQFPVLQKVSVGLRFRKELLKLDLVQLEIEMEK